MQTDVKSTHLNASGVVFAGPCRLKGYSIVAAASSVATVLFKDGGANVCEVDVPANSNPNAFYTLVPGEGVRCTANLTATLTNVSSLTVFYG